MNNHLGEVNEMINQDKMIRDMLNSSGAEFIPDKDINWRYWKDGELKIRSCVECQLSEFYSEESNDWPVYLTREHMVWVCDQILANKEVRCESCEERKPWYKP